MGVIRLLLFLTLGLWSAQASPSSNAVEAANKAVITQPARLPKELVKRSVDTCAFISGDSASPITCPPSYTCTKTVYTYVAFGCCNQIQCPGNWGACVNQGDSLCLNLGAEECSSIYGSILSCSAASPYCITYAYSSSLGGGEFGEGETWSSFACGPTSTEILALATSTNGGKVQVTATGAAGTTGQIPSTDNLNGSGSSAPTSSLGSGNPISGSGGSSNGGSQSGGSHLSSGAIIAIAVIATGVVLSVVCVLLWYCCCKNRNHPKQNFVNPTTFGNPQVELESVNNENISRWGANVRPGPPPTIPSTYGGSTYAGSEVGQDSRGYPRRDPGPGLYQRY